MEENRPDMYNKVMYAIDLLLDEDMDEEDVETTPPVVEDASFMDMEEGEMV